MKYLNQLTAPIVINQKVLFSISLITTKNMPLPSTLALMQREKKKKTHRMATVAFVPLARSV